MSCNNPLWAYRDDSDTQKPVKILGSNPVKDSFGKAWIPRLKDYREVFPVPCGNCIGCRLDYSKDWADRCVMESMSYDKDRSWFVTLTYDDEHLPPLQGVPIYENNPYYSSTRKEDYVLFMKRLRKYFSDHYGLTGVREFGCNEYGGNTLRPHYHNILFDIPLGDHLTFFKTNVLGDALYKCDLIEDIWHQGFVLVGEFNWRTAAYTARYIMKKVKGEHADEHYMNLGIERESRFGSNRPGIARRYFDEHYNEIYEHDQIILPAIDGKPNIIKPPRYFDDLYKKIDPLHLESVKLKRQEVGQMLSASELLATNLDEDEYFKVKENSANAFKNYRNVI